MFAQIKKNLFVLAVPALLVLLVGGAFALNAPARSASVVAATDTAVPGDHAEDVQPMAPCCAQCDSICDKYGEFSSQCYNCQNWCIDCVGAGDGDTGESEDGAQGACAVQASH